MDYDVETDDTYLFYNSPLHQVTIVSKENGKYRFDERVRSRRVTFIYGDSTCYVYLLRGKTSKKGFAIVEFWSAQPQKSQVDVTVDGVKCVTFDSRYNGESRYAYAEIGTKDSVTVSVGIRTVTMSF